MKSDVDLLGLSANFVLNPKKKKSFHISLILTERIFFNMDADVSIIERPSPESMDMIG